ncbi:hypothetical protein LSH36_37g10053 [Paralvinella palmiformis]|uniref:cystathionine gamma-lyase n=1 Tax=Paralvinella palmiformis TaxID=53620 RepID=A0AAD9KA11_9ANNE|nr:hypothetical protein LSH36_37g10053 [Paralvinella palmiformis]
MDEIEPFAHFATDALHAGQEPEQWSSRAVVPLISLSSTFKQEEPGVNVLGYEYSRSGNPTRHVAEKCLAKLENGKHCMLFSSGLAATTCITQLLSQGDHLIAMDDLYGGTNRFFRQIASKNGVEASFVDATNPENVRKAIKPNTRMVWIETPTNPTMKVVDLQAVSAILKEHPDIFMVTDNTFASSYFQRPLDLGSDMVFHSVTKYLNGHSDVVMGAVVTNSDQLAERVRFLQNAMGPVPSPFDCYLMNRGLKTLHLRMQQHHKNGFAVARFLEASPRIQKVIHPGLLSHPNYEVAKKQMRGFSGIVSFCIKGGIEEAKTFLKSVKVFTLAESLGGYESLAEHPGIMTHSSVPEAQRVKLGISDSLIRLSVGIEDTEDLIADIEQALAKAIPQI